MHAALLTICLTTDMQNIPTHSLVHLLVATTLAHPQDISSHISIKFQAITRLAPGIDGGGSVRVPAALCGVAALRPTVGRTSTAYCPPNAFSIMAFGVIAGCLADALLVYAAIANAGMLTSATMFAR